MKPEERPVDGQMWLSPGNLLREHCFRGMRMEARLEPIIRNAPHYYQFFSCLREPVRRPGHYVKSVCPTSSNLVPLIQQMMLKIICELLI